MFCLGRTKLSALSEELKICGSTGNVYTVRIGTFPTCSCPDHDNGHICKHVLFVFLRVLGAARYKLYHVQRALLDTELHDLFASARADPSADAPRDLVHAYLRATGQAPPSSSPPAPPGAKRRVPEPGDVCPICYEEFSLPAAGSRSLGSGSGGSSSLVYCEHSCGNACHAECFGQWAATARGNFDTGAVPCIFCRAPFPPSSGSGTRGRPQRPAATISPEGYLNLAAAAGVSAHREYSYLWG